MRGRLVPPRDIALGVLTDLTEPETDPLGLPNASLVPRPDRRRLRMGAHRLIHPTDSGEPVARVVHVGRRSPPTAPERR
nr:hypothetical protein [Streptomyces griseus]